MRYLFLAFLALPALPQALPLEQLLKQPPAASGTQDLQRFRGAVSRSIPVLKRGNPNQFAPAYGSAYSYLNGLEGGASDPARRRQLAYAYQDLGDMLGSPYGFNAGQQALAIQCFQRAMYLLGGGGMNPGSSRDLELLATRLTMLNAPFLMYGQSERQPEPARAPIEVKPTPGILIPPAPKAGEAREAAEVREMYVAASGRAEGLIANVDEVRTSLGARGLTLHSDIAGSLARMRLYFELAAESMSAGAWADARRQIEKGDYEAGRLAKHLGR